MEDEIHFLVNELEGELHAKVQNILRDLEKPVQKRDKTIINKFTRALVQATARRMYRPQPAPQQRRTDAAFTQLKYMENQLVQRPRYPAAQTFYTPVVEAPPSKEITKDTFLPSGLPPKPPEAQSLQHLPTDETLTGTPESFAQYRLPLSAETQKAAANPQFAEAPKPTNVPKPIALNIPSGIEPPIALIIDAESKKPIVSVSIQNDIYTVTEPPLVQEEMNMLAWLRKKFIGKEKKLAKKKKLMKKIKKAAKKSHFPLQKNDENEYLKMKYYLIKHLVQFGWIEPLFHDEAVTKISCEGENIPITIVRKDKTLKTNISYPSAEHINIFLKKFAERAYKKLSEKTPTIDFTANGYRVEGSLKSAATSARFTLTKVL